MHFSIDALVTDAHGLDVLLADWWHYYQSPDDMADPDEPFSARDCVVALAERRGAADRKSDVD